MPRLTKLLFGVLAAAIIVLAMWPVTVSWRIHFAPMLSSQSERDAEACDDARNSARKP